MGLEQGHVKVLNAELVVGFQVGIVVQRLEDEAKQGTVIVVAIGAAPGHGVMVSDGRLDLKDG